MTGTDLVVERDGGVLTVTFNRPRQHNAMTFAMYEELFQTCDRVERDSGIRVMVLRGAGDKAFVAGTDITQFQDFAVGDDGVAYERRMADVLSRLEDVAIPTVAAIHGFCVGGGLAIASVCDLRVATESSRFGVPIARTLGNALSINTMSLLVGHFGPARTLDLLLRARLLTAAEAHAAGFLAEVCSDDELTDTVDAVVGTLLEHAPLTMWAAKATVARLRRANLPSGDDIVSRVFGSDDFHTAVQAFGSRETVLWTGR